jgi:hypothetical protein
MTTHDFDTEISWLLNLIQARKDSDKITFEEMLIQFPSSEANTISSFDIFLTENNIATPEKAVLLLALLAHLDSSKLCELALEKNRSRMKIESDEFPLPTGETALWLLCGSSSNNRIKYHYIFDTGHLFYRKSVIELGPYSNGDSPYGGVVSLSRAYRDLFLYNEFRLPRFSTEFPAHLLTTSLEWEDLILMPTTIDTLEDVKIALKQYDKLFTDWNLGHVMRPGCRVLLYGDSGQGKTLTAALLGKLLNRPVYRVDIAASVSKYIGETNQRLEALFNTAENKDWILFFDEGDAMLGQRQQGGGENAANHYANQEVAFLLQRIETFNGIILVATNLRSNIDYAFQRRFDTAAQFKALDAERQQLVWNRFWPKKHLEFAAGTDLDLLIRRHGLSPASIINVIRRIASHMAEKNERIVPQNMLQRFIQDEEFKFKGARSLV